MAPTKAAEETHPASPTKTQQEKEKEQGEGGQSMSIHKDDNLFFFDHLFGQMERQIARMHQDMRSAMLHLTPDFDLLVSEQELEEQQEKKKEEQEKKKEEQEGKKEQEKKEEQQEEEEEGGGSCRSLQELQEKLARLQDVFRTEEDGSRHLNLNLDLSGFQPDQVEVKVKDGVLEVTAECEEEEEEEEEEGGAWVQTCQFFRQVILPPGTDVGQLKASLSKDGVLTVTGPLPAEKEEEEEEGEKVIPIKSEK